jgi:hypothetical protein
VAEAETFFKDENQIGGRSPPYNRFAHGHGFLRAVTNRIAWNNKTLLTGDCLSWAEPTKLPLILIKHNTPRKRTASTQNHHTHHAIVPRNPTNGLTARPHRLPLVLTLFFMARVFPFSHPTQSKNVDNKGVPLSNLEHAAKKN